MAHNSIPSLVANDISQDKKFPTGGTTAKPKYMAATVSSSAKYRNKVPISARSKFDNIVKNKPGIPINPSVLPKRRNSRYDHIQSEYKQYSKLVGKKEPQLIAIIQRSEAAIGEKNESSPTRYEPVNAFNATKTNEPIAKSGIDGPIQLVVNKIAGRPEWDSSTIPTNPDGPIKPLPPMDKYRHMMDAPRKKRAALLKQINKHKILASVLHNQYKWRSSPDDDQPSSFDHLQEMGSEEDFLSQYKEDKKLGAGSSGTVFAGWRRNDNKEVAIKKIKKADVGSYGKINGKLYPIEYCHLKMLSGCKGIANLIDAFDAGDEFILILETMGNCCDLFDCVADNNIPFEESNCRRIFIKLVMAVDQCHRFGFYHRDIKMTNILLDQNSGEVMLIDFDASSSVIKSPFQDNIGTAGYMSPEMYDESTRYEGLPAAVYSLGVTLYDLLFGAHGWDLWEASLLPKLSTTLSIQCLDLISKMTASRPENRLRFDHILEHPWIKAC